MTSPSDSPSPQDAASMDWAAIKTLRDTLRLRLVEVVSGGHLRETDAGANTRSVRADWKSIVTASMNCLADLLRLERFTESGDTDSNISSGDAEARKKSPFVQHAVLIECTASALLSSHEETQTSERPGKSQDLMTSLLKTISGAADMPLTLWTSGGAISGVTTSLADFFASTVDHLENKISTEHHGLLRQQSARLSNTAVLPNVILLTTAQDQKVAVRIEEISAWTLGSPPTH
ncbi:MAG: hypothetical protein KUG77_05440 [Nannocystaceae bacterium]|nr:hypothetical protein [Nannocystaceae bacterium]